MTCRVADMDKPLQRAVRTAGGPKAFFRALGLKEPSWTRTPQGRLFQVAALTGLAPETLRPDLAEWIAEESERRRLAASGGAANLTALGQAVEQRWDGPTIEAGLVDLWAALASAWYVCRVRGLTPQALYGGESRAEEAARAYAMALAKVVGRAPSTHIANVFQCSRQNVDNAAERYLRARDGDDPEDYIRGQFPADAPRVWEPGSNRLRRAKTAVEGMWDAQVEFARFLTGETHVATPAAAEKARRA